MAKRALTIAVERYKDAFLSKVQYAEADALSFSKALEELGCPPDAQTLLLNEDATNTLIDARVHSFFERLTSDDEAYVFFAGHGFFDGHHNYLAAHDSMHENIERTSFRLQKFLGYAKESHTRRVWLFLDACHTGIKVEASMRSTIAGLKDENLEFCAGFASCRAEQKSRSSSKLGHGIWTYYLLQALTGQAPAILREGRLHALALHGYLSEEVCRAARELFTDHVQTPRIFGSLEGDPLIADLSGVLERNRREAAAPRLDLERIKFLHRWRQDFADLPGFEVSQGHFVPRVHSAAADKFAKRAGRDYAASHVGRLVEELKKATRFTIEDLDVEHGEGFAAIACMDQRFEYAIAVGQDAETPSEVEWKEELHLADITLLTDKGFASVFARRFDTLQYDFSKRHDINPVIEALENARTKGARFIRRLDYDEDGWCAVEIETPVCRALFSEDDVECSLDDRATLTDLVQAFGEVAAQLATIPTIARLLK